MTDQLLVDSVDRLLRDHCTMEAVQRAEADRWAPALWDAAADMGLPWISLPEEAGGAGGELGDALAVLRLAGAYAMPLPLAETCLLAGWLVAGAGLPLVEGPMTVVPGRPDDDLALVDGRLRGTAHGVPWATAAERVVALVEEGGTAMVVSVPTEALTIEAGTNLAGEPRDRVRFDGVEVADVAPAAPGVDATALLYRGALTRVMLIAGALARMSELTIEYSRERRQFGVPIRKFQAVQEHLVRIAQDAVVVSMAADLAARECGPRDARFEIAAAKLLANQACATATRAAHQAHGAMGMTQEYPLHHVSRRLWSWRSEYGNERFWAQAIGRSVERSGAQRLYPTITAGSKVLELAEA